MIISKNELKMQEISKPRGGEGVIYQSAYLIPEWIRSNLMGFNLMELPAGASIGFHQHCDSEELYYILEGNPIVKDNEREERVEPGTVIWTGQGNFHAMKNDTEQRVQFLAFVVKI